MVDPAPALLSWWHRWWALVDCFKTNACISGKESERRQTVVHALAHWAEVSLTDTRQAELTNTHLFQLAVDAVHLHKHGQQSTLTLHRAWITSQGRACATCVWFIHSFPYLIAFKLSSVHSSQSAVSHKLSVCGLSLTCKSAHWDCMS